MNDCSPGSLQRESGLLRGPPSQLPALPGCYALELSLAQPCTILVGRLGLRHFLPGTYLYLGSARGPGGLRARLARHLRPTDLIRAHWHIDYLRAEARVVSLAYMCAGSGIPQDLECRWSQELAALPGAVVPVHKFGASDCASGCQAHLVAFELDSCLPGAGCKTAPLIPALAPLQAAEMVFPLTQPVQV